VLFKDPYSAQVSIILPQYCGRYKQESFRVYVEKLIHLELPAHIYPNIIWMKEQSDMEAFEKKYEAWLKALCKQQNLQTTTNKLIDWFADLQSQ